MKNTRHFLTKSILAFVIVFVACSSPTNTELDGGIKVITVDSHEGSKKRLSQIIDSVSFIPLETIPEALIGRVGEFRIHDSRIYIKGIRSENCLFVFHIDGKFLFKLDNSGKGPGEFVELTSFCVTENMEIVINDFSGKKLLFYNNQGQFEREIFLDFFPSDIAYLNEDTYAITSYRPSKRLIIMDSYGKILKREFDGHPDINESYNNELVTVGSGVYFRDLHVDTLFRVEPDNIAPEYNIDFQDKKLTRSDYLAIPLTEQNGITSRRIPSGYRFGSYNISESSEYISFYFWETPRKNNHYWCIYNKLSGESTITNMGIGTGFDDLFGRIDPERVKTSYQGKFCYILDSYSLINNMDENLRRFAKNKPESLDHFKDMTSELTIESNPVVVLFSIKED